MAKRRDVITRITKAAAAAGLTWKIEREGARHTVYTLDGLRIPIPRHTEIGEGLTEDIYKECAAKLGKGWWRQ